MIDLSLIVGFEWDQGNERKNDRHGVSQSEAEEVFFKHPLLMLEDQRHSEHELRLHALGQTEAGRARHITFTLRAEGTLLRVISGRDMHRKERRIYEQAS